jgi:hypothetical protein
MPRSTLVVGVLFMHEAVAITGGQLHGDKAIVAET